MMQEAKRVTTLKEARAQIIALSKRIVLSPPNRPRLRTAKLPAEWTMLKPHETEKHLIRLHALIHLLREEGLPGESHTLPQWAAGSLGHTYGRNLDAQQRAKETHERHIARKK